MQSNHKFTKAQVTLTRAQVRLGPGVDTPLIRGTAGIVGLLERRVADFLESYPLLTLKQLNVCVEPMQHDIGPVMSRDAEYSKVATHCTVRLKIPSPPGKAIRSQVVGDIGW